MIDENITQFGDDKILEELFNEIGESNRFIVDVGVRGKLGSNTWRLLSKGWSGILIDADPKKMETIKKDFTGMDVKILQVGVSDCDEELDFYEHSETGCNSFLKDWHLNNKTGKTIRLRVRIDIEGMDERVVKSMFSTSIYRPRVIITEAQSYGDRHSDFFGMYGYTLYMTVGVGFAVNFIYIKPL
jgi:hypothetical protein